MGGTTYLLGQALPSVTRLLGVDLFVRRKQRLRFFARPDQRLTFFDGSSYDPTTVARVARDLGGEKLDLLFIDGDHSLQGVAKDFAAYRGFVRDGGIIVFHDVVQDYTTRYGRVRPATPAASRSSGVRSSRFIKLGSSSNRPSRTASGSGR